MKLYERDEIHHPAKESFHPIAGLHQFKPLIPESRQFTDDWTAIPLPDVQKPQLPRISLIRPEFSSPHGGCIAGYGFVVRLNNLSIMLTALHVLDPIIKTNNVDCSIKNINHTGDELPALMLKVNLYDVLETRWVLHLVATCHSMLSLRHARIDVPEPDASADIAAFEVNDKPVLNPLNLAKNLPQKGDAVWLHVKKEDCGNLISAVVVECTEQTLIFRFAEINGTEPKYTSGAPLVDRSGKVVGINIGAGRYAGQRFGHANHVANIRRHLESTNSISFRSSAY
ncbi:hypothetical protein A5320_18115 [Rheinheimera sp. SA_1]|uniref:trypsin-like peptidase domain-containing protein n=1 Tax=Rheinheimera sp. SA_1 TaxID=1827365 RepID=UPI0007FE5BC4|nr:trypsin-like peptidase domain-containing protein [Rheinheimera sp. SA_1]OBP13468.1 hypothetical protein A5320_18115 [Rheinheimera sp. SA_1]